MAMTVLIAYDVSSDNRRAKLAALLQSWGDRIQFSVFICSVDDDQLSVIKRDVQRIIDEDDDSVFIVRQCKACWSELVTLGQGEAVSYRRSNTAGHEGLRVAR